jgi:nicotinate-nucleotide adenylyltransferase
MRLGVMGGSFDPVHLGHLWIATFAREQLHLDSVLLVPASSPPHKTITVAPYSSRLEWLRALTPTRPWLVASDLESDHRRPSYTVETLRRLAADRHDRNLLWLLIGADSLQDLPNWREPGEILRLARLGVYGRPGYGGSPPLGAGVDWIDGPLCGLSSTLIRGRLQGGQSVAEMVPHEIVESITAASWYKERRSDG